jgi:hypothetical protein
MLMINHVKMKRSQCDCATIESQEIIEGFHLHWRRAGGCRHEDHEFWEVWLLESNGPKDQLRWGGWGEGGFTVNAHAFIYSMRSQEAHDILADPGMKPSSSPPQVYGGSGSPGGIGFLKSVHLGSGPQGRIEGWFSNPPSGGWPPAMEYELGDRECGAGYSCCPPGNAALGWCTPPGHVILCL